MLLNKIFRSVIAGSLLFFFSIPLPAQETHWLVPYHLGKLWGLADTNARIVIPPRYEEVDFAYHNRIRFRKKGRYGFLDEKGKVVIPPIFQSAQNFTRPFEGSPQAKVLDANGKPVEIDLMGKTVSETLSIGELGREEELNRPTDPKPYLDRIRQETGSQYDSVRVAFRGKKVETYSPRFYVVYKKGKAGLLDLGGKLLFAPKYHDIPAAYESNFIVAREGRTYLIIDENDERLYQGTPDSVLYLPNHSFIQIREDGKWGLLRAYYQKEVILPPAYDQIYTSMSHPQHSFFNLPYIKGLPAGHEIYLLKKGKKMGAYSTKSSSLAEPAYSNILSYRNYNPSERNTATTAEYLYVRLENGKEGYVDLTGKKRFFK